MTTLTPELERICILNHYHSPVIINGMLCALSQQFTTVGITVGIDDAGYSCRFCFKEFQDAKAALKQWAESHARYPGGPWIKVKGRFNGVYFDDNKANFIEVMDQMFDQAQAQAEKPE